jgi:1,4-alpha-glucan branching enzyme
MAKPIHFYCQAPGAKEVAIVGDFNDWSPSANPLKQMPDGTFRIELLLHHGHHQYYFLVDGKQVLDPRAQGVARNAKGERVSLIPVS